MRKVKKSLVLILLVALVVSLLAACGGNTSNNNSNNNSNPPADNNSSDGEEGGEEGGDAASTDPIKIGFVGPLTGDAAAWGIAQLKAVQIRVDKCNQEGGLLGRQVELYYYDNREDAVETVNAARKLIENDNVVAIIGPNNSVCAQSMSSICDDYKVPMICTNTPLEKITLDDAGNVRPYVFRAIMIQRAYVDTVVDYLYNTSKVKTAACLYQLSNDTNVAIVKQFQEKWEAAGGTITDIETTASADDVDFRAQLTKIIESKPDVIFSPFTYKQIILMAQQARELGFEGMFAGCDTWFQVKIPTEAGAQVAGCVAIASLDVNDPILDPIKAEWLEYWGEDQTLKDGGTDPYYGYDAWMMLRKAIEDKGAADSESIRDGIEHLEGVQGCSGILNMDPETHNPSRQLAIVTISDQGDGTYAYETLGSVFEGVITLK